MQNLKIGDRIKFKKLAVGHLGFSSLDWYTVILIEEDEYDGGEDEEVQTLLCYHIRKDGGKYVSSMLWENQMEYVLQIKSKIPKDHNHPLTKIFV